MSVFVILGATAIHATDDSIVGIGVKAADPLDAMRWH